MGENKWNQLKKEQKENYVYFKNLLKKVFENNSGNNELTVIKERVLETPNNPISIGLTLTTLQNENNKDITRLGSMLFSRCVSGCRVVVPKTNCTISKFVFDDYGSHIENGYPSPYLTVAAAFGIQKTEADEFVFRLLKCFHTISNITKSNNMILYDELSHDDNKQNNNDIKIVDNGNDNINDNIQTMLQKLKQHNKNEKMKKMKKHNIQI